MELFTHGVLSGGRPAPKPKLESWTSATLSAQDVCTINKPTGVVADDLLVIVTTIPSSGPINGYTGFSRKLDLSQSIFLHLTIDTKRATGSEGATFVTDLTGSSIDVAAWCGRFSGWVPEEENDEVISNGVPNAGSTTPDPDSLTIPWGSGTQSMVMAVCCHTGAPTDVVNAAPAGFELIAVNGASCDVGLGIAIANMFAGSVDPSNFTLSGSELWVAATYAAKASST